jgi:hypothetical protein
VGGLSSAPDLRLSPLSTSSQQPQPQLSSVVVQAANFFQFHYTRSIAAEQLDDGIGGLTSRRSLGAASVFAFFARRFLIAVTVGEGIDIQSSGFDI